jgi:hypothetical protein
MGDTEEEHAASSKWSTGNKENKCSKILYKPNSMILLRHQRIIKGKRKAYFKYKEKQEFLGRIDRLLSFDITRTQRKGRV